MAKVSSKFICQQCGYESPKWMGKCPDCGSWNTMVETVIENPKSKVQSSKQIQNLKPQKLSEIKLGKTVRISTKISELDRVLGGGLVPGQVVLLAGEPGAGKSTIMLQVADNMAKTIYASGEESAQQIKIRAQRLGVKNKNIELIESTDIDSIIDVASNEHPGLLVVDSIQTMSTSDLTGLAGSVGQVRETAFRLVQFAKKTGTILFIIGHVTKEGTVAGPSVLAHIVDSVIWFEGDKNLAYRLLRAVKNRFGPTDEVGIFSMEDSGLSSIVDSSKLFLSDLKKSVPGSVISSIMEGTRPILIELQALVVPSKLPFPKRVSQGIDGRRLELMLAILQRRAGLPLWEQDVFVNVVGGIVVKDPACDLALCLAIAGAFYDRPLEKNLLAVGEVGLLGEVRSVPREEKIIKDAKRQGYKLIASSSQYKYLGQAIKDLLK